MKRYLITGFSGFVAYHFVKELSKLDHEIEILGVSRTMPNLDIKSEGNLIINFKSIDLRNENEISGLLKEYRPNYIVHLASDSSVGYSWQNPVESFNNNTNIFLNLIEAVRMHKIPCRILSVGSSEEYGNVTESELPLIELSPLKPLSPYAVARVSQEMMSKVYVDGYGLDIIMTRSFNHIGTHQRDNFVIPSFAKQLAMIKLGLQNPKIIVGNLSIIRDFVDVQDVVKAYNMLIESGRSGDIYNICSNEGSSLSDVLNVMKAYTNTDFEIEIDSNLIRPKDNLKIIGSNEKIRNEVGWSPEINLKKSVENISNYWINVVKNNASC
jgi:GDP-4-dehydro-6-deoxy-D-mannose reductase